jgi:tetratricopeptide (TPR) repeat protein
MVALSIPLFMSEAVSVLGTERMLADVSRLDVRGVAAAHRNYDRLRQWGVLHIGRRRLDARLKQRLVAAAGAVIEDYRQDDSTVAEAQWRQASHALDWAEELGVPSRGSGDDADRIEAKRLICQGHLDRIAAQTRSRTRAEALQLYDRAIDEFERAARLDPDAADPYLGLGRIYIYARTDVDRATAAIDEAERRGHMPGWRERALLGDGYRQRADAVRRTAARAPEEAQRAMLENARDDYARCVDFLAPILDKARSKYNHTYCQRHLDELNRLLDADTAEQPEVLDRY